MSLTPNGVGQGQQVRLGVFVSCSPGRGLGALVLRTPGLSGRAEGLVLGCREACPLFSWEGRDKWPDRQTVLSAGGSEGYTSDMRVPWAGRGRFGMEPRGQQWQGPVPLPLWSICVGGG